MLPRAPPWPQTSHWRSKWRRPSALRVPAANESRAAFIFTERDENVKVYSLSRETKSVSLTHVQQQSSIDLGSLLKLNIALALPVFGQCLKINALTCHFFCSICVCVFASAMKAQCFGIFGWLHLNTKKYCIVTFIVQLKFVLSNISNKKYHSIRSYVSN